MNSKYADKLGTNSDDNGSFLVLSLKGTAHVLICFTSCKIVISRNNSKPIFKNEIVIHNYLSKHMYTTGFIKDMKTMWGMKKKVKC